MPLVRTPRPWLGADQITADLAHDAHGHLVDVLRGADSIVHLAGLSEVVAAADPDRALAETVLASLRLAEAGRDAGIRRVVYVSTVHVYGTRMVPGAVLTENLRCEPRTVYALARLASEHVIAAIGNEVELVVLRLTNSVGAPAHPEVDRWSLVANDLCRQAVRDHRIVLRTSGVQYRDFVDLGDVCSALAMAADPSGPIRPGTYNLGSGRPTTVRCLAETVQDCVERATGARPPLEAPEPDCPSPDPYFVSASRLRAAGVSTSTPIESSIEETVRFCLAHLEELERV
jgi:UDP-glucose 4-epimerase